MPSPALGGVRKGQLSTYVAITPSSAAILRAIEDWTGTKLIQRTAAGSVLTEDGVRYHRDIASALDIIARATVDLIKRGDHRCLHIRCMPGFRPALAVGAPGRFRERSIPGSTWSCNRPIAARVPGFPPPTPTSRSASSVPTGRRCKCRRI